MKFALFPDPISTQELLSASPEAPRRHRARIWRGRQGENSPSPVRFDSGGSEPIVAPRASWGRFLASDVGDIETEVPYDRRG